MKVIIIMMWHHSFQVYSNFYFTDIKENGIPSDIGVIINAGDAGTSWSGAEMWKDEKVVAAIRGWVASGGGFIGVGEPSACEYNGAFFQLSDVLGVQKEAGYTVSHNKPKIQAEEKHFITSDLTAPIDYGEGMNSIYKCSDTAAVLDVVNMSCSLAVNTYGKGRAVYIAGLPFNENNARLLLRALYWSAGKEPEMLEWYCENPGMEYTAFPGAGSFVVVNNTNEVQKTVLFKPDGTKLEIELQSAGYKWFGI